MASLYIIVSAQYEWVPNLSVIVHVCYIILLCFFFLFRELKRKRCKVAWLSLVKSSRKIIVSVDKLNVSSPCCWCEVFCCICFVFFSSIAIILCVRFCVHAGESTRHRSGSIHPLGIIRYTYSPPDTPSVGKRVRTEAFNSGVGPWFTSPIYVYIYYST